MNLKRTIPIVACFLLLSTHLFSQSWEWVHHGMTPNSSGIIDVASDASGNLYGIGSRSGALQLAGNSYPAVTNSPFMVKFDATGTVTWFRDIPGTTSNSWLSPVGLEVDALGNVFVLGSTNGFVTWEGDTVGNAGSKGGFIAQYNTQGQFQWSRRGTVTGNHNSPNGLDVDNQGNVFFAGSYTGSFSFGTDTTLAGIPSYANGYVVKLNASGAFQWAVRAETPGNMNAYISQVTADNSGNVYIGGSFDLTMTLGQTTLNTTASSDIFLAKLGPSGNVVWVERSVGNSYKNIVGLEADNLGYLALTGDNGATSITFTGLTIPGGNPSRYFVARIDTSGLGVWATNLSYDYAYDYRLKTNSQGDPILGMSWTGFELIVDGDTVLGDTGTSDIALARFNNTTGSLEDIQGSHFQGNERVGGLAVDGGGNTYMGGSFADSLTLGGFGMFFNSAWINNMFFGKYSNWNNDFTGTVFNDVNGDSTLNGVDYPISNILLKRVPGNLYYSPDTAGVYLVPADTSSYQLSIIQPPYTTLTTPANPNYHEINFSGSNNVDSLNDFGLHLIGGIQDLRVTLTAITAARPGFDVYYDITYQNMASDTMTGTVQFNLDNYLTYTSATPTPNVVSGQNLTWNYASLLPLETRSVTVKCSLSTSTPLNTPLVLHAQIDPIVGDSVPENNVDSIFHVVTGAFDPNDKAVIPFVDSIGTIDSMEVLTYRIRFQNTGTDTAFTVRIEDDLPAELDPASIQLLAASHPYVFTMSGNGKAVWTFNNILLPDSNTNEPASHGFVKFSISTQPALTPNTQFQNNAGIYFDFNQPVITNSTINTIACPYAATPVVTQSGDTLTSTAGPFYQWYLDGNPINGASAQSYVATQSGTYHVMVSDIYGCSENSNQVSVCIAAVPSFNQSGDTLFASPGYNWQWYLDGNAIQGGTSQTYVPTQSGVYSVWVEDSLGCGNTSMPDTICIASMDLMIQSGDTLISPPGGVSWEWFLNGTLISGANSNAYIPMGNGVYHVEWMDSFGCLNISDTVHILLDGIDPGLVSGLNFEVYPNPATQQVNVRMNGGLRDLAEIRILDLYGRVLIGKDVEINPGDPVSLDLAGLVEGLYLLEIKTNGSKGARLLKVE